MTDPGRLREMARMKRLYYLPETTDERKLEMALTIRTYAEEERADVRCVSCGHGVFYIEDTRPRCEGHVYSREGEAEYFITRFCEWCFDLVTAEEEEE